jgi:hypothetical protein
MTKADVEFWRMTPIAVSPHYPGFLPEEVKKGINAICDMALVGIRHSEIKAELDRLSKE